MFEKSIIKYGHPFIGIDWGTTNFRSYLIGRSGELLNESTASCDLVNTSKTLQAELLVEQVNDLRRDFFVENDSEIPVLIIGMAGSSIGLRNVDYLSLENSLYQLYQKVECANIGELKVSIVPGFKGKSCLGEFEVMRGEETQILGWLLKQAQRNASCLSDSQPMRLCLPGTHTKWVEFETDKIRTFDTVPTGEVFAKLSRETSLCVTEQSENTEAFLKGVQRTVGGERFNEVVFSTRTKVLSGEMLDSYAASYLSGLLIGTEIYAQLTRGETGLVHIIGNEKLNNLYQSALEIYGVPTRIYSSDLLVRKAMNHMMSQMALAEGLTSNSQIKDIR